MVKLHREWLRGLNDLLPEEEASFVNCVFLLAECTHRAAEPCLDQECLTAPTT
jgi:hypothetical protein